VGSARVGFAVHGDGLHPKLLARADHPERDLAAVSDQYFAKHAG